jgi:lipopolysaccharide transport system ATP-binding protein
VSTPAIRVEGLGKRYRIGSMERYGTLRETLTRSLTFPLRGAGRNESRNGKRREQIWALRDASFEIRHGEAVGVIGRNGAGKTTLLRLLSRITEPTEGRAELRGRVRSLLEVGTGFHLELTGRENIFLNGAIMGMRRAEIVRKFDDIVEFAEVGKFIDTPVKRYSSGMSVRLAFAVAAHLEPDILLVDEVLAVGDVAFQRKCLGRMGTVAKQGRTVLFVSHNMETIRTLCPRTIQLEDGRVVADGPSADVTAGYLRGDAPAGEVTFGPDTIRTGTGRAIFTSARIVGQDGSSSASVPMGEGAEIELRFEVADGAVTDPSFDVDFLTSLGQPVMRLLSRETHGEMPAASWGGTVRLSVDRLDFLPDSYYLTLGLSSRGEQLDLIDEAIRLEITPAPVYTTGKIPPRRLGYLVFAPCSWSTRYA